MKKAKVLLSSVLLSSMLLLAACGGGGGSTGGSTPAGGDSSNSSQTGGGESSSASSAQDLIIATGGTSGTYYPLGGGMAEQIKEKAGIPTTAQVTGASAENMRLIRDKSVDIAFTQSDIADYASKGEKMFEQDGKLDFKALGSLYDETIQIVVSPDSGINSVADLKGKRVSVGAPGSGTEANAEQILEVYGLKFDDMTVQRLSFGDSAKAIQDGQLDAAFQTAGTPTAAITELAATKGVKIISIEPDKVDALIAKYPYYVKTIIPGNTYQTVKDDVSTVSVRAMLVVRSDLSEDDVYKVTKAIFENTDKLNHVKSKEIRVESALSGVNLEVHPGAKKYFEEKGVK
ncbi:TAXI family TRAP transporter solute-binding subunit [Brevibacillus massiliensis]|uniref:TAXI family TRAP transporter solute-binding subunit n=1 Tax=Brevibacillus massiliensis TaxID=1118054 RepID=UPI000315F688|nr:TAXI family TRAP transporter solute-binding subunit [Brevibacillus massiliensis]